MIRRVARLIWQRILLTTLRVTLSNFKGVGGVVRCPVLEVCIETCSSIDSKCNDRGRGVVEI